MNFLQGEKESENRLLSLSKLEPYRTQLRLEVIAKRRERTRLHFLRREKTQVKRQSKGVPDNVVTIDTNKARSNTHVVRLAIRDLGWREFPFQRRDQNCDITWHAGSFSDQSEIYSGQVNKFPGSTEVFRKVNTFRWLEFMKTLFPREYSFFPKTWLLPYHFNEFAMAVQAANENKSKHKPVYIVKPSEGSQGQGIYLLEDPFSYSNYSNRSHVVQEYLSKVFLLDKYKFDLRVYVVLKCLDPLEFHISREGLARFSTVPYEQPTNKNFHETFMHLTNYSLNKKSIDFKVSDKDNEGSKRKMSAVFKQMGKLGHDVDALWGRIEHLVALTLIAVAGELKVEHEAAIPSGKPGPTCFQVLGFDIILLSDLQPMLLEVNSNPSLSISEEREMSDGCVDCVISLKDVEVKRMLIRDTLRLVAPKNKYTRRRQRQHHHRRPKKDKPQNMDTDNSPDNSETNRRKPRQDKDTFITHVDNDTEKQEKSMFYKNDTNSNNNNNSNNKNSGKTRVRKENCRVFIEGKGEVLFPDQRSSVVKLSDETLDQHSARISSIKNWLNKLMETDHVLKGKSSSLFVDPDVVPKDEQPSSEGVAMEEGDGESEGSSVFVRIENSQLESSWKDAENDDEEEEKDEEDDSEEQLCLKEIFPALYGERFKKERVVERLADIFILCLGIKGCLKLSPSMFRLFGRRCHLHRKGINSVDLDILYIELERKFDYMNAEKNSGLNFFAFVYGCSKLASKIFPGSSPKSRINDFIHHCQKFVKIPTEIDTDAAKRGSRLGPVSGRNVERDLWKLPSAEGVPRMRGLEPRTHFLDDTFGDLRFPILHNHHRNIFHMLQRLKK